MADVRAAALGLDYGTESVRALIVECATGRELAEAVVPYADGVIVERLPGSDKRLPADFALQNPDNYLESGLAALKRVLAVVPASDVIGVGVDFTACTILPILADGTPLMRLSHFKDNPHAWAKLWKHHAAQPEADRINELARERSEPFLRYYSGMVSSEWMLPKCWEIARHAPEVYETAACFIDAGDWIVLQLTGLFTRNACAAGYKGFWSGEHGFPSPAFLAALDPAIAGLRDKWLQDIIAPGRKAGEISPAFAAKSGLIAGTPVSAATIDAHSGVAGMGVYREGPMSLIMGTSTCHMALSSELRLFDGFAGVVKDGIIPGFYGYESGQSAVGDIFGWFAKRFANADFEGLSNRAAALAPGQSGLLALDWMNGNRSVLMNADLSGCIVGLTLDSRPEEIYRALVEATAFGTRMIVETHQKGGVRVDELAVCGGLTKIPFIMQVYADVTGLPVKVAASSQAVALGAAIFGALAADESTTPDVEGVITRMTKPPVKTYQPDKAARAVYDELYGHYSRLHEHFGRSQPSLMKDLKRLKSRTLGESK